MKLRSDFVSNSSSSSFMINDHKKAYQLLNELGEIPWCLDDHFRVNYKVKHKDYKDLYEYLTNQQYKETRYDYWQPGEKYQPPKPDEDEWIWCEGLSPFLHKMEDDENHLMDKIETIEIVLDENHNEEGIAVLSLIYEYFKAKGLNPDTTCSELSFTNDSSNFIVNLVTSLMKCKRKVKHGS